MKLLYLSACLLVSYSYNQKCCSISTLEHITTPPSSALFFWEEAKWCSQRIPLLNNYPFRWNCMTIYGLPHLFQPGSKMLIAPKISICGSTESGFIVSVGLECDSDSVCASLGVADVCLCVCVCSSIWRKVTMELDLSQYYLWTVWSALWLLCAWKNKWKI